MQIDSGVEPPRIVAKTRPRWRSRMLLGPTGRRARSLGLGLPSLATTSVAIAAAAAAAAERVVALPAPGSAPWRTVSFRGIERATRYEVGLRDGAPALRARAECSASALLLPLEPAVDLARTPRLRWRWVVERAPDSPDETARAGDDFAARVIVLFAPDPAHESGAQRWRRELAARVFGEALPGRAQSYLWATREPPGRSWRSPFAAENAMAVLRSGSAELGSWRREEVDLAADHVLRFAAPAPPAAALALMTDADQTCGRAEAWYADFAFVAPD